MAAKTSLRGKVKNIFSGQNKTNAKAAQAGASWLLSKVYQPISQRSATDGWATNKMVTAPQFNMSKAMGMIKPNPSKQAQVGTWAVAPMSNIPKFDVGLKDNTLAMAALNGANALFSGWWTKPRVWSWGWGQQQAAPATPPAPTSPLQDTVDRLLSRAWYASSYKPKKDSLANTQKDQNNRYLAMYGPFKSIE